VPRSSATSTFRASPVNVPIASKKFANTSVNTNTTAARTPIGPNLSKLKSPASDRSAKAIAMKVTTPPRSSAAIVDRRAEISKNRSRRLTP
jgi:hypothetical protein